MFCNRCGRQVPDESEFCPECGADLREAPRAAPGSAGEGKVGGGRPGRGGRPAPGPIEGLGPGTVLADRYELRELLGAGRTGVVYRAYDRLLEEECALKVFRPGLVASGSETEELEEDLEAARKLIHRNIVRVYRVGREGSLWYVAMELLAGRSLRTRLDESKETGERLPVAETKAILSQVLEALVYAHAAVVHLDLHPGNVFLEERLPDGLRVTLLDFGLGKVVDRQAAVETKGGIAPASYLAPEWRADGPPVDARADLYSVGVLACELLTGKIPGESSGWPSEERDDVDSAWDAWVRRALASDPVQRFETAEEMLGELEELAEGSVPEPVSGEGGPGPSRAGAPGKRPDRLPSSLLTVVLVLIVLVGGALGARRLGLWYRGWRRQHRLIEAVKEDARNGDFPGARRAATELRDLGVGDDELREVRELVGEEVEKSAGEGDLDRVMALTSLARLLGADQEELGTLADRGHAGLAEAVRKAVAGGDVVRAEELLEKARRLGRRSGNVRELTRDVSRLAETRFLDAIEKGDLVGALRYLGNLEKLGVEGATLRRLRGRVRGLLVTQVEQAVARSDPEGLADRMDMLEPFGLSLEERRQLLERLTERAWGTIREAAGNEDWRLLQRAVSVAVAIEGTDAVRSKLVHLRDQGVDLGRGIRMMMKILPSEGHRPGERRVWKVKGVEFAFHWIPGGPAAIGSPEDEPCRSSGENRMEPWVDGFWMGESEVTQRQWEAVMGNNPSHFSGSSGDRPVEMVSWNDAMTFVKRLNRLVLGGGFEVPWEGEWEYACRGGSKTPFGVDCPGYDETSCRGPLPCLDTVAWYRGNSGSRTHPVGELHANAWGLYDCHGNVAELCLGAGYPPGEADDPAASPRPWFPVLRGGSWDDWPVHVRGAYRGKWSTEGRDRRVGFRIKRTVR